MFHHFVESHHYGIKTITPFLCNYYVSKLLYIKELYDKNSYYLHDLCRFRAAAWCYHVVSSSHITHKDKSFPNFSKFCENRPF